MEKDINSIQYHGKIYRVYNSSFSGLFYITNKKLYQGEIECFLPDGKKDLLDNFPNGTECTINGRVVMAYSPLTKAYGQGKIIHTTERKMVPCVEVHSIRKTESELDTHTHFHISGLIREKIEVRKRMNREDAVFHLYCTTKEDRSVQCLRIFSPHNTTSILKKAEAGSYIYCVCDIHKAIYKDYANKGFRRMMTSVYLKDVEIIRNGGPSVF